MDIGQMDRVEILFSLPLKILSRLVIDTKWTHNDNTDSLNEVATKNYRNRITGIN